MFFSGDDSNANTTNIYNNVCYASDNANTGLIDFGANGGYAVTKHVFKNNIVLNTGTNTSALINVSTIIQHRHLTITFIIVIAMQGPCDAWSNGTTYTQAQWADYLKQRHQVRMHRFAQHLPTPSSFLPLTFA